MVICSPGVTAPRFRTISEAADDPVEFAAVELAAVDCASVLVDAAGDDDAEDPRLRVTTTAG